MVHAARVAEIDRRDQLPEVMTSYILAETAGSGDLGEEFAAADEFHGEINLGYRCHHFMELDDARVGYHFHNRDLAFHMFCHAHLDDLLFSYHFHRDVLAGTEVAGKVDLGKTALAKNAAKFVAASENVSSF